MTETQYDFILELRLVHHDEPDEVIRFGVMTTHLTEEEDSDEMRRIGGDVSLQDFLRRSFNRDKWTILDDRIHTNTRKP